MQSKATSKDSLLSNLDKARQNKAVPAVRLKYVKKAEVYLGSHNDTATRNALYKIAKEYSGLDNASEFHRSAKRLLKLSTSAKDSLMTARTFNLVGNNYLNSNRNDSAFYYLLKSEKLFAWLGDSLSLGQNYIDKSFAQLYEGDYSGSELSSIQSLSYLKDYGLWQKQYDAYNLIGICANELRNFDNAINYHQKALQLVRDHKLYSKLHLEANSLNNIGVVNQNMNDHAVAIQHFRNALTEKDLLIDSPSLYAMITDNLGYSEYKLHIYAHLPDLFLQSLKIREKNKFLSSVIVNKIHLSEYYIAVNDSLTAKRYAAEALTLSKETKIVTDLLIVLKQLSIVDTRNASKYSKEYIKISDSLQQAERIRKDKFARIQFETDEILSENDRLTEQNRGLLYIFGAILIVGLLLFIIRLQRAKNRELLLMQAQQKANEDIYSLMISQQQAIEENRIMEKKRIARELHDGVLGRLFGTRLNLDHLNKMSDTQSVQSRFEYLEELKNIEQDIREISHDLNREKDMVVNNFAAIVLNLIEGQRSISEATVEFYMSDAIVWKEVDNMIKINLYRILQESLQNINKYAMATRISVSFKLKDEAVVLEVIDDGVGFDANVKKKGIGLTNITSRAKDCSGKVIINSSRGKGTTITITIPVHTKVSA